MAACSQASFSVIREAEEKEKNSYVRHESQKRTKKKIGGGFPGTQEGQKVNPSLGP